MNPVRRSHIHGFARLALPCIVVAVLATTAAPKIHAASFDEATERYRGFMIADMDRALAGAQTLRDRIKANDIPGAKKAWIDARIGWERSEVFTSGFIPELDDAIDAWPDAVTGFHGMEVKLFGANSGNLGDEMDKLIVHLTDADERIRTMQLTPQGLLNGVTRLAYEIGDSKVDGGKSRLSGTSLDDMRNNADGIELAYRTLFASRCKQAMRSWRSASESISAGSRPCSRSATCGASIRTNCSRRAKGWSSPCRPPGRSLASPATLEGTAK